MNKLLAAAAFIVTLSCVAFGQATQPLTRIILKDGTVISTDPIFEDSTAILIKRDGQNVWIQRADIKEIVRLPPCSLKPEQSPALRGFKLGQTFAEVRRRFPPGALADPIEDSAVHDVEVGPKALAGRSEFAGIRSFKFSFLDGLLVTVSAYYEPLTNWTGLQFKEAVSEGLKIQQDGWNDKGGMYILQCDGFKVRTLTTRASNLVILGRDGVSEEIQKRMDAIDAEIRKMFKP